MELFWLEHKKLWRKKIVKICVLLCFVYCVIFGLLSNACAIPTLCFIPPENFWWYETKSRNCTGVT
jgi:hypothetical protein